MYKEIGNTFVLFQCLTHTKKSHNRYKVSVFMLCYLSTIYIFGHVICMYVYVKSNIYLSSFGHIPRIVQLVFLVCSQLILLDTIYTTGRMFPYTHYEQRYHFITVFIYSAWHSISYMNNLHLSRNSMYETIFCYPAYSVYCYMFMCSWALWLIA